MIDPITLQTAVRKNVTDALAEDIGTGDLSASLIPASEKTQANVITRDNGVFCGQLWVAETMDQIDNTVVIHWKVQDTDPVKAGDLLFTLSGASARLLTAERTMLNFAQFLSGVATKTAQYSALIKDTKTVLLDTRKTVPGLRIAQKYAVACGGGQNHRLGLFDAYLLKENHICAAGSIALAVSAARRNHPDRAVEVETENLDELQQAIEAGADIAMIEIEPGYYTGSMPLGGLGAYRLNHGDLDTIAAVGMLNPIEYAELLPTADILSPLAESTGGTARMIGLSVDNLPSLRRIKTGNLVGNDWIGLRDNNAYTVTRSKRRPLAPPLVFFLAFFVALAWGWWREAK